ncbi:MAG TPA: glycosyltransferase family 4 protein [Thermomonas sp.]|uniref:MraY family glycosyltransferase n=1 Tax=Thermomonas sp. TaxID=1971895 RepID=UPI002B800447|nr:glycosyltransferase family 4 protein [Thermomonas sp.]HOV95311.1 glycosyltransferase family 4 protein [Thermomonas sp.]
MPWSDPPWWLPALAAFAASLLGTLWALEHAHRQGLLDHPGARRSHQTPTARGGGLGIAVAALLLCAWLGWSASVFWYWAGVGLLVIACIGWWDDHRSLPAWPRLVTHVVAGAVLAFALWRQGQTVDVAIMAFVLVPVLVNVWNFMDGIDGLATSQAALCACAASVCGSGAAQVLALSVLAACLGFLPFNYPKARIFLGDVGSGVLGYLVALLLAVGLPAQPKATWLVWLLPASLMWVDAGMTLFWRILRGERWWQPHVQHVYQRLARRVGHRRVTAVYAGWTALAIGIMLVLLRLGGAGAGMGGVVFWLVSMLLWFWLHRKTGESEGFSS